VRLNFDWDRIEPEPGARVWDPYDTVVPALQRQGITVIGVFVTLPAWAANDPAGCVDKSTQRERCLGIRFGLEQHLADLCAELVQRYQLTHLEFWNEPDLWPGLSDPIAYAHWLWWAAQGARQANPTIKIAAASEKGAEFFAPIYRDYLPTKPRVFDALSLHPYWPRSAADLTRVDALQAMLQEIRRRSDRNLGHRVRLGQQHDQSDDPRDRDRRVDAGADGEAQRRGGVAAPAQRHRQRRLRNARSRPAGVWPD
jgi:hypothetical protein